MPGEKSMTQGIQGRYLVFEDEAGQEVFEAWASSDDRGTLPTLRGGDIIYLNGKPECYMATRVDNVFEAQIGGKLRCGQRAVLKRME